MLFFFQENKLHMSWSDSSFIPYLNEATVLDYFCDTRNPFYNPECNNQLLKMQGINPEQLRYKKPRSLIYTPLKILILFFIQLKLNDRK